MSAEPPGDNPPANDAEAWTDVDEEGFVRLLSIAEDLHARSVEVVEHSSVDILFEDAELYPAATLVHLERWAAIQFAGGLVLLTKAPVAIGAIVQLRGILEAYSHVWWIRNGSDDGAQSRRCRALCYERSSARELLDAVTFAAPGITEEHAVEEASRRVDNLDRLLQTQRCRCKGRGYSDVMPTIQEIVASDPTAAQWLVDIVRSTRMSSHQTQRDRVLSFDAAGAVRVGAPATPIQRALLLDWLVVAFARFGRELALILGDEPGEQAITAHLVEVKLGIKHLHDSLRERNLTDA